MTEISLQLSPISTPTTAAAAAAGRTQEHPHQRFCLRSVVEIPGSVWRLSGAARLQPQPLDVLAPEVDAERQDLTHLRRGQPPRQGAGVGTPVIQNFSHLWRK